MSRCVGAMIAILSFVVLLTPKATAIEREVDTGPAISGWLHWRGPFQNGTSQEQNLPQRWVPGGINHFWSIDLQGRGTPVIARYRDGERLYAWGYRGETDDLVEVLVCLDAKTGQELWQRQFADFISDIIYNRYSIGSPTVDPQTGNVYLMTTPGLLMGFDRDGTILWQRSMMEQFGRLSFPNGRTGAPAIEGDLVIVNVISANWGREGPGRNRFYAFDKASGELAWSSTPGIGPPFLKDSSFSSPVFEWRHGKRVFYAGTGCGNIVCVNARTGDPLWRFQLAVGGVNSSVVLRDNTLIAIHGKENVDDSGRGRMVAIRLGAEPKENPQSPVKLDPSYEVWRNNDLSMFTSSPVMVDNRVYQVTTKGDLVCVDAANGTILWHKKLGADQLHASPLYADGKLYIPMWHDGLYIVEPTKDGARILDHVQLEGACIGSPSVWNGRIYVHTTKKLYCFGRSNGARNLQTVVATVRQPTPDNPQRLQIIPSEILLRPGQAQTFHICMIDANGFVVGRTTRINWDKYIPPTAKVKATLNADFDKSGRLVARRDTTPSAGAFRARMARKTSPQIPWGTIRGRILPVPPYTYDFESFDLKHTRKDGVKFSYPPLPWIGARLKWQVRDLNDNKVLAKTLDRWLFQRSTVFIGHADDHNYTMIADVMSDGNRRGMSDVGLVNQRYNIILRGNGQQLEVNSNIERLAQKVPFSWKLKTWYRLKTRVDISHDGSGLVRAKAWPADHGEPTPWTIQVHVQRAHRNGSPGLFGFSPNIRFAVYIDNVVVTGNE